MNKETKEEGYVYANLHVRSLKFAISALVQISCMVFTVSAISWAGLDEVLLQFSLPHSILYGNPYRNNTFQ